jgi:tetratricopeptide (TPR) repeat protein
MRRWLVILIVGIFLCGVTMTAQPHASAVNPKIARDRRDAIELYDNHKNMEALPLLERLAKALPEDAVVYAALGVCRVSLSATLQTPEERKRKRIMARQALLRAKELGDTSDLVVILLQQIPEDGADQKLSDNAEVDRALQAGESAFAAEKMDVAREDYLRAIALDPNSATAMLYLGDVYYSQKQFGSAIEWFKRASEANPNLEAAHRYCADALIAAGRYSEARAQYILAVVIDPYHQASRSGLNKWSKFTGQPLTWYDFHPEGEGGEKDSAWVVYTAEKASWHGGKFKQEFPTEPKYRNTLKEETSALSMAANVAMQSDRKLSPDLERLLRLQKLGFIDAYVLFNAGGEGISQDYVGYRDKHRDVLMRYLNEIVVPPAPPDMPTDTGK